MDSSAIDSAGLKPLAAELAAIEAVEDRQALETEIADLQRERVNAVFRFFSAPDFKDSSRNLAQLSQGGLGMPYPDYYLREDDKSKQLRTDYVQHVAKMLELAGDAPEKAAADAQWGMAPQTGLA